ncbi:hypothetical protein LCGC14_1817560 [marine sediment metagenome]|uniref:Uncharacterized protein n=1 Tax=marine sediment metagenome TaxID=412755 RepID=A0A0F9H7Z1_9ZZZZ
MTRKEFFGLVAGIAVALFIKRQQAIAYKSDFGNFAKKELCTPFRKEAIMKQLIIDYERHYLNMIPISTVTKERRI